MFNDIKTYRGSGPRVLFPGESAVPARWLVRKPVLKSQQPLVVGSKELIFHEIAAYLWHICHSTTGRVGNTTFRSACMAIGILASTSFDRFYVEFTKT